MNGVFHIARRGLESASGVIDQNRHDVITYKMPAWGIAILVVTVLAYCSLFFVAQYTLGSVVMTIATVESTDGSAVETEPETEPSYRDDPDAPLKKSDLLMEGALAQAELQHKSAPITSRYSTAIRHLRVKAGKWSVFRGMSAFIFMGIITDWLRNFYLLALSWIPLVAPFFALPLATATASIFLATWTHIVISMPSKKIFFKRLAELSKRDWLNLAPATLTYGVAFQAVHLVPKLLAATLNPQICSTWDEDAEFQPGTFMLKYAAVGFTWLVCFILIGIPAEVILKRVQASALPAEHEPIVPFDRTFGGRVVPKTEGGSGVLGMLDAWRSFDGAARVRVLKLSAILGVATMAGTLIFLGIFIAELRIITGDVFYKVLSLMNDGSCKPNSGI